MFYLVVELGDVCLAQSLAQFHVFVDELLQVGIVVIDTPPLVNDDGHESEHHHDDGGGEGHGDDK